MTTYAINENGVVTNVIEADAEFAATIGAIPLPEGFGIGDFYDGAEWTKASSPPPPPPTPTMVNAERDRRLVEGTPIPVTGYGDIPLTGTDRDMTIITALLIRAQTAHATGITSPSMVIRDKLNVIHNLTPAQMLELTSRGMQWVEDTMATAWAMKDGTSPYEEGIPSDFTDDVYWQ